MSKGLLTKNQTEKFVELLVKKRFDELEEDIGFSSNIFMIFGLPTKKLQNNPTYWIKKTSLCKLTITRHPDYEVPYGCFARMNQIFIDTEVRTKNTNIIDLGRSFSEYVEKVGYKRGYANRSLLRQLINYITSVIRIEPAESQTGRILGLQSVVGKAWDVYFDIENPEQLMLEKGEIILDESYAKYIHKHAVPLDMNVIRFFKRNPLAIDFYRFLAYRTNQLNKTISFPDILLFEQLGTEQQSIKVTRNRLKRILEIIKHYWPVNAKFEDSYFEISPSPPAVQKKIRKASQIQIVNKCV